MDNIFWQNPKINVSDRRTLKGHKSCVLWLTGLSASGKSTIAKHLDSELFRMKIHSYILDGDNIRQGLNKDLSFSPEDRKENIRRIGEVAKLFVDAGTFTIAAFISPYLEDRNLVRAMFPQNEFIEVFVKCSIEECERRDPKGLYKKARTQQIKEFTGISAPYEEALAPEITVNTEEHSIEECTNQILRYLFENKLI